MATWKKVIVSGSDASLNSLFIGTSVTASVFSGSSFTGSLFGTASWANNATSASFAATSSLPLRGIITASAAFTTITFTKGDGSTFDVTVSQSGSVATASYAIYAETASVATSASFATTASYWSGSVLNATSASYALTASYAANVPATASYALQALSSSFASTASFVQTAQTASYVLNAVSASFATTASYAASTNNIGNAVTNNVNNYVLTATGGGTINGESNLTFDGSSLLVTGNATITGDLTVQGTTTTIDTTNLLVEDKFVLFASGSTVGTDGGVIIQASTGAGTATGFAFGYKTTEDRWAYQDALAFNATSFSTPTAFATTTQYGLASTKPNDATGPAYGGATYGYGNIWVSTDTSEIWIYA